MTASSVYRSQAVGTTLPRTRRIQRHDLMEMFRGEDCGSISSSRVTADSLENPEKAFRLPALTVCPDYRSA
ncbi:MAG: hypothetical protein KDB01_04215 [Planctomycetaceae bacterium]|nr:hypothetical protein [Planctomycetaceae bacterium]